jgi:hypothetical protein
MNLLYIFLSIVFSSLTPSTSNNEGLPNNTDNPTSTTIQDDRGGKQEKMSGADYIIGSDIMP